MITMEERLDRRMREHNDWLSKEEILAFVRDEVRLAEDYRKACERETLQPREQQPDYEPQPIGACPKCASPIYTAGGFCGGCKPGR